MTHTDRRVLHDISLPHLAPGTTFRHPGGTSCYCRSGSDSLTLPSERLVLTTACICQRLKPEHWTFPLARAAIFRAILFLLLVCNLSATCGNTSFDDRHEGEHPQWRITIDSPNFAHPHISTYPLSAVRQNEGICMLAASTTIGASETSLHNFPSYVRSLRIFTPLIYM